jgi:hypothetical protein
MPTTLPSTPSKSTLTRNPHLWPAQELTKGVQVPKTQNIATEEQRLNKTERRFLAILRARHGQNVRVQAITLVLANRCRYTPDFSVCFFGKLILWEIKGGFIREDSWIKLKMAARLYPEFDFVMAQWKNGEWTEVEIHK